MDEATFLNMSRTQGFTAQVSADRASSLLAQMVLLNRILCEINDFNIQAANTTLSTEFIMSKISALSTKLDDWLAHLPAHMHDTRTNLLTFASQGLGQLFVTLYLGYYHYGQMLFYRFLHEDVRGHVPRTHFYANKCKEHAVLLCEMIYSSDEVPGCDVLYNMVGHVLVIASTVQIHTLLSLGGDGAAGYTQLCNGPAPQIQAAHSSISKFENFGPTGLQHPQWTPKLKIS
ncbi:hypothetical protein MYU51_007263 [Penicillium brevicompactum]